MVRRFDMLSDSLVRGVWFKRVGRLGGAEVPAADGKCPVRRKMI